MKRKSNKNATEQQSTSKREGLPTLQDYIDLLKSHNDMLERMVRQSINQTKYSANRVDPPSTKSIRTKIRLTRLICINNETVELPTLDGGTVRYHGTGLEFLERYTSNATEVDVETGESCYVINEITEEDDKVKLASRFAKSNSKRPIN